MTREEAIERLKQNKAAAEFYAQLVGDSKSADNELKDIEAFNMAIEALFEPSGEHISRAEAVKTVIRMCAPICGQTNDVVAEINALPSAEAEQGCDGCRYDTRIPREHCLRCKRYWRDGYERKGGDTE